MSKKGAEFLSGDKKEKIFLTEKNIDEIEITPENEEEIRTIAHKNWAIQGLSQSENPSQTTKTGIRYEKISLTVPGQKTRNDIIQDVAWGRISDDSLRKAISYVARFNDECEGDPEISYEVLRHGLLELEDEVQDIYTQEVLDVLREATRKKGLTKPDSKRDNKPPRQERVGLTPTNIKTLGKNAIKGILSKTSSNPEKQGDSSEVEENPFIIEQIGLRIIDKKEKKKVLKNLFIEGDDAFFRGGLNKEIIERSGLAPAYEMRVEDTDVLFSKTFDLGHGRAATLGYVKQDSSNLYRLSTFYRSNSQGLWRLLPDYNDQIYGKGWRGLSEDSLNLPIELQCALHNLANPAPEQGYSSTKSEVALSTTRYFYANRIDSIPKEEWPPYYREIPPKPLESYGSITGQSNPEELQIQGDKAPDFTNEYLSYDVQLPLYGDSHIDCYWSKDKERKYIFIKDSKEQAALLNIETTAPLSSTGLRSEWIEMGRFGTPLYEYFGQGESMTVLDGIQSEQHPKFPEYGSTFKKYLSRVPIIQDYLAASQEK